MRNILYPIAYPIRKRQILAKWEAAGRPNPPPAYFKHDLLKKLSAENSYLTTFVETGTWKADTLWQLRNSFKTLHSVELDFELFVAAKKRLSRFEHIRLWQGHSPEVLELILENEPSPSLFWLDAHYMAGGVSGYGICPVLAELETIFEKCDEGAGHLILIDDARNFIPAGDYPTLEEVTRFVNIHWPSYKVSVHDDIIHCQGASNE